MYSIPKSPLSKSSYPLKATSCPDFDRASPRLLLFILKHSITFMPRILVLLNTQLCMNFNSQTNDLTFSLVTLLESRTRVSINYGMSLWMYESQRLKSSFVTLSRVINLVWYFGCSNYGGEYIFTQVQLLTLFFRECSQHLKLVFCVCSVCLYFVLVNLKI